MKVRLNDDKEVVKLVKEGLKAKDGYCPCMAIKTNDTKCICKDFREKMEDESFEGLCHCGLYYKEK